ncbi:MAG: hypothetical protein WAV15_03010 [Minisyncoccia bacterium]
MIFLRRAFGRLKFMGRCYFLSFFAIVDYFKSNRVYNEPSVCAFYQCFNQPKCVIATIKSFREFYPNSSVYLFSNKGLDMSHIASHFNCKYEYLYSGNDSGFWFLSKEEVLSWVKRLLFVAQNSTEDFVMILEDDARMYGKIKKLKFDFNGIKPCEQLREKITAFLKLQNKSIPNYINNIYYGGCGGTLINRNFIVNNFSNQEKLSSALDAVLPYAQEHFGTLPADALITMLVLYFGGTIGPYAGFAEVGSSGFMGFIDNFVEMSHWKYYFSPFLGRIEVVHNDKSFYNVLLSEEENKIFLGK